MKISKNLLCIRIIAGMREKRQILLGQSINCRLLPHKTKFQAVLGPKRQQQSIISHSILGREDLERQ